MVGMLLMMSMVCITDGRSERRVEREQLESGKSEMRALTSCLVLVVKGHNLTQRRYVRAALAVAWLSCRLWSSERFRK